MAEKVNLLSCCLYFSRVTTVLYLYTLKTSSSEDAKCQNTWTYSTTSSTCIKLFQDKLTWQAARDFCKSNDGDLIIILDEEMNKFLGKFLKDFEQDYWIGLNVRKVNGDYGWLSNSQRAHYIKWAPGQPNSGEENNCVQMRNPQKGWSTQNCRRRNTFLCERFGDSHKKCSNRCAGLDNQCDFKEGTCILGCKAGYKGAFCEKVCDDFTFGENCSGQCSPNCAGLNMTCDHKNGTCTFGCDTGYKGPLCDIDIKNTSSDHSSGGIGSYSHRRVFSFPYKFVFCLFIFVIILVAIMYFLTPQSPSLVYQRKERKKSEGIEDCERKYWGEEFVENDYYDEEQFDDWLEEETAV